MENGVGYAKGNALGRLEWESDEALDEHLTWWMREVADVRVHGTTHERPIDRFEMEKAALKPVGNHPSHLRCQATELLTPRTTRILTPLVDVKPVGCPPLRPTVRGDNYPCASVTTTPGRLG